MTQSTATRQRLSSTATTLHHPLDYYFNVFLRAKQVEGLKPRTLNDHKNHYRYLQRWLVERYPTLKLDELTADHLRQYIQHMLSEQHLYTGHPTPDVARPQHDQRLITHHCQHPYPDAQVLFAVPPRRRLPVNRPRFSRQTTKGQKGHLGAFTKVQVLQLLAAPNEREYVGFCDYVLFTLLFDTGLRINEALHLTVDDLNVADKTITVPATVAKNGTSRVVPITKRTAELLAVLVRENYQQFIHRTIHRQPSFMFLLNNGKP